MSRSISISFRRPTSQLETVIEVRSPYFLLGTQDPSKEFWSLPGLREIGVTQLAQLGAVDPVGFIGWERMAVLGREILLLQQNMQSIDFDPEVKARWVAHLVYCYHLLIEMAPKESIPDFTIG